MTRLAAGFGVVALGAAMLHAQDQAQFRATVNTVPIYTTVIDRTGHFVQNLSKDDFQVFDNGVPTPITEFTSATQPITAVVMLDRSVTLQARFDLERDAAEAFVASLIPGDRLRIGSFNGMIRIDPDTFTGDRDTLIRILHLDLLEAGFSPLWNAATAGMNALRREDGRRVLMLFADGLNKTGLPGRHTSSLPAVLSQAQTDDIQIYAIGIGDGCGAPDPDLARAGTAGPARFDQGQRGGPPTPVNGPDGGGTPGNRPPAPINMPGSYPLGGAVPSGVGVSMPIDSLFGNPMVIHACSKGAPDADLQFIAANQGGAYAEITPDDHLPELFASLAEQLRHQYLLGITTTRLDGATHTLEVRTHDTSLHVRARAAYVASARGKS